MSEKIKKKKMTIATRFFLLFFVVMVAAEGGYFWFSRHYASQFSQHTGGSDKIITQNFNPAQSGQLKRFLEAIGPGEKRRALLESGKTYRISQGLFLQKINSKNKIILQVKGYEKDKNLKAIISAPSGTSLRILNSTKMEFRGIQFQSNTSSVPAVSIKDCNGLQFENCIFAGEGGALKIVSSYDISFKKVGFWAKLKRGIYSKDSRNLLMADCAFRGENQQGQGLYIEGPAGKTAPFVGTVRNCTFEAFQTGIYLSGVKLNIYQCTLKNNRIGIRFDRGSGGKIGREKEANQITSNREDGIVISGQSRPQIYFNTIGQNGKNAIVVQEKSGPTIKQNTLISNGISGVSIFSGSTPSLVGNFIGKEGLGNKQYGIYVEEAGPTIMGNSITANLNDGIHLKKCGDKITLRDNTIHNNKGAGIFFEEVPLKIREKIKAESNKNDLKGNQKPYRTLE